MNGLYMANGIAVGIFGMFLSAAFCDIAWTRQKKWILLWCMTGILFLQGVCSQLLEPIMVRRCYPVITHIPLAAVLCLLNKKRLWPFISVFTAYLCCQLRRWLALLILTLFDGTVIIQYIAELVITVPLFFLLFYFIAPAIRSIAKEPVRVQWQFGIIPVLWYGFDYLTQIYTNLFSKGEPLVAEFMSFVCCVSYLIFVFLTEKEKQLRNRLEQTQLTLHLQVEQAVREIALLREAEHQAKIYRHDLRHHLQYITTCMQNGRIEQAQNYIQDICAKMEATQVLPYCENEVINLIFSSFAERAKQQHITMKIRAEVPSVISICESDVCVLLSNALENALHACQKVKRQGNQAEIEVVIYEKAGKLFLQITNSCEEEVLFEQDVPVSHTPGHGMGVRSICAIVEQHKGMYTFTVKDGQFMLRISL